MLIKYIKAKNYKTYKNLDLDLEVKDGKSIILIGGKAMCGKTTLFDAIGGALYGLKIKTAEQYKGLMNNAYTVGDEWKNREIELEIMFEGLVMGRPKTYKLRRLYKFINDEPVENVRLDFDNITYSYGTHTPISDRKEQEENVGKIIKANMPSELRRYFLFDALRVGLLADKNQIEELIKDNISSVMGFNKYLLLKESSRKLIEEANAARLGNEHLKQEYTRLLSDVAVMKGELDQMKTEKEKALAFSIDNRDTYQSLLSGQQSDAGLKEKIDKARKSINEIIDGETKYNQRIKDFVTTLETDIFVPKIASIIKDEAEAIIAKKDVVADKKKGLLTDKQIKTVTNQIIDIINSAYGDHSSINADYVAKKVKELQDAGLNIEDEYYYLDDADVRLMKELVESKYANIFGAIDRDRIALNQRVSDIPQLKDNIEAYKAQLAGDDYSLIKRYEDNEELLKQLKLDIVAKERDMQIANDRLSQFDFDENKINDIKYEILMKLPDLFDAISSRLLAARKNIIEQNMKTNLNQLIPELSGMVDKVELNIEKNNIIFKIFHVKGNEINLNLGLSASGKQILIQALLKELRDNGDYDPPVMIDTVMGNLDSVSRKNVLEKYFPHLATQTILFSNDLEITPDENGYGKLRPYIAKAYLLNHNKEEQYTTIDEGYFDGYK